MLSKHISYSPAGSCHRCCTCYHVTPVTSPEGTLQQQLMLPLLLTAHTVTNINSIVSSSLSTTSAIVGSTHRPRPTPSICDTTSNNNSINNPPSETRLTANTVANYDPPSPSPVSSPIFMWGTQRGHDFTNALDDTYKCAGRRTALIYHSGKVDMSLLVSCQDFSQPLLMHCQWSI